MHERSAKSRQDSRPTALRISTGSRYKTGKGQSVGAPIERIDVASYRVPTDFPESDGTLEWDSTTIVLVEAGAGNQTGLGYSYASHAAMAVIREMLLKHV